MSVKESVSERERETDRQCVNVSVRQRVSVSGRECEYKRERLPRPSRCAFGSAATSGKSLLRLPHRRPLASHTHGEAPPPTPLIEGIMSDANDCFNCCLISGEWDY